MTRRLLGEGHEIFDEISDYSIVSGDSNHGRQCRPAQRTLQYRRVSTLRPDATTMRALEDFTFIHEGDGSYLSFGLPLPPASAASSRGGPLAQSVLKRAPSPSGCCIPSAEGF